MKADPEGTEASSLPVHQRDFRASRPRVQRGRVSPLTLRILAVNVVALGVLAGGLFYLDEFRQGLIRSQIRDLEIQAEIIAGALAAAATTGPEATEIDRSEAMLIMTRLVAPADSRARLFARDGAMIVDSRDLAVGSRIIARDLPARGTYRGLLHWLERRFQKAVDMVARKDVLLPYREALEQSASDYPEVERALEGEVGVMRREGPAGTTVITAAVPVQRLHRVLGALLVSGDTSEIDRLVEMERVSILEVFGVALGVTLLLSLFLSGTIARPIRLLADAADRVRPGQGRNVTIPDFSRRRDEIGDLSRSLHEMTEALFRQIDLVETFAADVSHEMKNPITSMRSALETLARTGDPGTRDRLLAILADDVERLNRLISDISAATRLDAEMARSQSVKVDITSLLRGIVMAYDATRTAGAARVMADLPPDSDRPGSGPLLIDGFPAALGQVMRNLIDNALTFSPPDSEIVVALRKITGRGPDRYVEITVEDNGPGIAPDRLEAVFSRFYSDRPAGEAFGKHSGLGLNISKHIIEAHGGEIFAENRLTGGDVDSIGKTIGARFVIRLPLP
ncbi:MAG: stimulus-sensing domain-containing protein [Sphingomonadales bacterium]